ncbi:hypothetical protein Goklo_012245 [Gossypium klotzschianum]|uniref:Uncharacterized protein n=1 Tax=Gossypium klotzschianum TaxID=34286 RepID=A0A7J8VCC3_9ROSI|nr:hypothetical protein [Gossypium klotzschianum]
MPTQIRLTKSENNGSKVVLVSFYARSVFITSLPPSHVLLPAFFTKKIGVALKDDVATSALRRILWLDL